MTSELKRASEIKLNNDVAQKQLEATQLQLKNADGDLALKKQEVEDLKNKIAKDKSDHEKVLAVLKTEIVGLDKKKAEIKAKVETFQAEHTKELEDLNKKTKALDGKIVKLEEETRKNEASKVASENAALEFKRAEARAKTEQLAALGIVKDSKAQSESLTKYSNDLKRREERLPLKEQELAIKENELNKKADDIEQKTINLTIREKKNTDEEKNLDLKREVDSRNTKVLIEFLAEAKLKGFQEDKLARREEKPVEVPVEGTKGVESEPVKVKKAKSKSKK